MDSLNLNSLVAKNVKIELGEDEYIVPQQPPMEFILQFYGLQQEAAKSKKPDEQINTLVKACVMILNQDADKNVDEKFILKNLNSSQMRSLAEFYSKQIEKVESDPN